MGKLGGAWRMGKVDLGQKCGERDGEQESVAVGFHLVKRTEIKELTEQSEYHFIVSNQNKIAAYSVLLKSYYLLTKDKVKNYTIRLTR